LQPRLACVCWRFAMKHLRALHPVIFCLLTFAGPATAHDRFSRFTCANSPTERPNYVGQYYEGVDTVVTLPAGVEGIVSYFRSRAEVSWMVACYSNDFVHWYQFATSSSDFGVHPWSTTPFSLAAPTYIRVVSDRYHDGVRRGRRIEVHDPWDGVTRRDFAWGSAFGWYDSAGPGDPNTIIYICTNRQIACPPGLRGRHRHPRHHPQHHSR
jgi:hypothetical protein